MRRVALRIADCLWAVFRSLLKNTVREIEAHLRAPPDFWFFDFFNVPFNQKHADWDRRALEGGLQWLGQGRKYGGNVWGLAVPPGSHFVALDNLPGEAGASLDAFDLI